MSEKQLTVAELMARAAAEGRAGAPKRRRRRSLEDGGISVAELTGNVPKVDAKPEEPKHTSEPIDAPEPPAPVAKTKPAPAEPIVTVVDDKDPIKLTTDSFPAQTAPVEAPADVPAEASVKEPPVKDAEKTAQIPLVTHEPEPPVEAAEDTGVLPVAVDKPAEEADDERVSIVSVLLMVVAGLAIGAAIFLGFKELWANVNPILTGALAGVMTLAVVGVVHALRTERDGLSMVLAGVTGLAVTFGPLLIVGL